MTPTNTWTWPVSSEGYKFEDFAGKRCLVEVNPRSGKHYWTLLDTMPALLAALRVLSPTEVAIERFASRFGRLTSDGNETLGQWKDLVQTYSLVTGSYSYDNDVELSPAQRAQIKHHRIYDLNSRLQESVGFAVRSEESGTWHLRLEPRSLLGAIWLGVALTLTGELRVCPVCHQALDRSGTQKRKKAEYCSDKCRAAAGNERKREAKRLVGQGMNAEAVALRVGVKRKTARGWIRSWKKQGVTRAV